ncbi:hypothetical protein Q1695_002452 [Nippostrongylus brasiliensis]|nr:hypothetical protein Q1695_002452 [Nippostrongylus brasiliensis]
MQPLRAAQVERLFGTKFLLELKEERSFLFGRYSNNLWNAGADLFSALPDLISVPDVAQWEICLGMWEIRSDSL